MKYVGEYRDPRLLERYARAIARTATRRWRIMEVCGGQTHAIVRFGLDQLLPPTIELLHGPGCPVCVTPIEQIDRAIELALEPHVTLCSFGDMLRVPGSKLDLLAAKSRGGDVRVVYSPLDALELALREPAREVVFFAVGFETTAPATAMAVLAAEARGIANFSLLVSHVLVPPAMDAIAEEQDRALDGFLAAGHVCTIVGSEAYRALVERRRLPVVVTGFEPADLLMGVLLCVEQLETGRAELDNQYTRAVRPEGNTAAQRAVHAVFEVVSRPWRGIGWLEASGLALRASHRAYDAEARFPRTIVAREASSPCIAGEVLRGKKKPCECPAFGRQCTPDHPLGAPMVSGEGACAAYHRYRGSTPGERGPA
jgi:hydrogenase expression/formation protein HypD